MEEEVEAQNAARLARVAKSRADVEARIVNRTRTVQSSSSTSAAAKEADAFDDYSGSSLMALRSGQQDVRSSGASERVFVCWRAGTF
jgi:hypothetical protein